MGDVDYARGVRVHALELAVDANDGRARRVEEILLDAEKMKGYIETGYPTKAGDGWKQIGPSTYLSSSDDVVDHNGQEYLKPCGEFVRHVETDEGTRVALYCIKPQLHAENMTPHEDKNGYSIFQ